MAVHRPLHLIFLLAAGLILAGCKDTKIATYRVLKESRFAPPTDTVKPTIRWQTPSGW